MSASDLEAMDAAPSPFHAGEREIQSRVGVRERMDQRGARAIRDFMPEQHRSFFAFLPLLFMATATPEGWPVATALAGAAGFVASPAPTTLRIAREASGLTRGAPIGVLGIDFSTRRRNRANGRIAAIFPGGFDIAVEQSFGNCDQYIQARAIGQRIAPSAARPEHFEGVDAPARAAIEAADTFLVASGSAAGMDMSHRGGRPGFVRVDGNVLTIPDFSGNRYFNTLGNFVLNPRAALLFPDFATGDLLHVTGAVEFVWEGDEVRRFAGAQRLWRLHVTAGERRRGALGWRWSSPDYAPTTIITGNWGGSGQ
ncbi:MAG: pyridoxamine 5'-phosphate oxidase family protein [Acetobacteraceae bacterium]